MNGWKNYPTWAAAVWGLTDIDQEVYEQVIADAAAEGRENATAAVADYLQGQFADWAFNEIEAVQGRRGYVSLLDDLLVYAISDIDWYELAASILADYAVQEQKDGE